MPNRGPTHEWNSERCIYSVWCLHEQQYVMISMISRPIFIHFQLYTEMFAEGGDGMNNSLKRSFSPQFSI